MRLFFQILLTLILMFGQTIPSLASNDSQYTEDINTPVFNDQKDEFYNEEIETSNSLDFMSPTTPESDTENEDTNKDDIENNIETPSEEPKELFEITEVFNKSLLTKNQVINYGDTATLSELENSLINLFQGLAGLTPDEQEAALIVERIELGNIDVFKPGEYPITVILKLHEDYIDEFTISDETRTLSFNIYIPREEGISLLFISSQTKRIQYNIINPQDGLSLWYAITNHGENPTDEMWQLCTTNEMCIINHDSIYIYRNQLRTDQDYLFQLRGSDIESNVIRINLNEHPSGSDGNYMGGDKDGNDNNDNTIDPPLSQIPPSPPANNEKPSGSGNSSRPSTPVTPLISDDKNDDVHEDINENIDEETNNEDSAVIDNAETIILLESSFSSTPTSSFGNSDNNFDSDKNDSKINLNNDELSGYEIVDGDTMIISEARLAWLIKENSNFVPLGWNEVSVEFPTEMLSSLSLAPDEMLSIKLTKENDYTFTILMYRNNTEIKNIGETIVYLPISKATGIYVLTLDGSNLSTFVSLENGYAVFTINQTGCYQLIEDIGLESSNNQNLLLTQESSTIPPASKHAFIPLFFAFTILSSFAFLIWRKRP